MVLASWRTKFLRSSGIAANPSLLLLLSGFIFKDVHNSQNSIKHRNSKSAQDVNCDAEQVRLTYIKDMIECKI